MSAWRIYGFGRRRSLETGIPIEFVLTLPKEITMTRDVKIHCFGRITRVEEQPRTRGVAARIEDVTHLLLPPT